VFIPRATDNVAPRMLAGLTPVTSFTMRSVFFGILEIDMTSCSVIAENAYVDVPQALSLQ
jgi:hypothetical protein